MVPPAMRERSHPSERETGGPLLRSRPFSMPSSAIASWSVEIGTTRWRAAVRAGSKSNRFDFATTGSCSDSRMTSLADDLVGRRQEHPSGQRPSWEAAATQALIYLGKAEGAHRPTQALYALRARCHTALGEVTAAQADTQRANQTPATMALDHFLR